METKYWLNLLHQSQLITQATFDELMDATDEVSRILYSILRTMGRTKPKSNGQIEEALSPYLTKLNFLFEEPSVED